ncbi:IS66 family insertion sequence element accessory protein TnpB [Marinomonas mediterranea]|jgi:Transposase and inactivated derivatives|uniref:IS66 Orf2 family protein n=1 Tax=Marinomonas mediterranea (strain ATCC 700492 / JCM 21426 / NBRC 103028 / MMB-1) TaxID=717774 RepID=F2K178_MARM1|nr:IS66 family insertion sequence element accessory protein TnpB [Marinomonas mediterranea]ADZ89928.1 IS66 Orf2 family protein [Marinomonas mediterranea MMB-1]WCN08010.1 IS66 family insertion sequence element accessory protein TnpB [Marinomonas mediterranea]WCN12105.1 IS66 family insertion sequence element accessory protein TnpB [Marinomonas mediterranea]WCN16142.1 IS66 family insertion sequence element accessory protein TnpB [Marinomonas mediterranea MMB-1]
MFTSSPQVSITLICGPTDMRKAIDGLCDVVAYDLEQDPCSEHLFVFCGRTRNKLKILQWSANGFWLHYKRLEKGTFKWPGIEDNKLSIRISARQLNWLLEGLPIDLEGAHPELIYRYHGC